MCILCAYTPSFSLNTEVWWIDQSSSYPARCLQPFVAYRVGALIQGFCVLRSTEAWRCVGCRERSYQCKRRSSCLRCEKLISTSSSVWSTATASPPPDAQEVPQGCFSWYLVRWQDPPSSVGRCHYTYPQAPATA
ncbi:hypothetical protein BS50DRAFT_243530 [Corynespora cassiicola Philippines]|uniref:Uncharacterized protein n=1 Tax=Corynespora cassiicola Philippines TaxID=1448308 RepID=A0A2T2P388_CORCC|nr:hypothetical protein BS50DRAFT_243530 [Corynespora cassiicola Philippines]